MKFGAMELLPNQKQATMCKALKRVCDQRRGRGFRVNVTLMDGQFECLRGDLASVGINLNSIAREEHMPVVERHICTIKETTRSAHHTLPFKKIAAQIIVQMVHHSGLLCRRWPCCCAKSSVATGCTECVGDPLSKSRIRNKC